MLGIEPRYPTIPTRRYTQTFPCCNLARSHDSRLGARGTPRSSDPRPSKCPRQLASHFGRRRRHSVGWCLRRARQCSRAVPRIANPPYCAVPMRAGTTLRSTRRYHPRGGGCIHRLTCLRQAYLKQANSRACARCSESARGGAPHARRPSTRRGRRAGDDQTRRRARRTPPPLRHVSLSLVVTPRRT